MHHVLGADTMIARRENTPPKVPTAETPLRGQDMSAGQRFDLPTPDEHSSVFWDAARQGRLLIERCRACGRTHFYPRPFCPHCWSDDVGWEEASGRATLYTYSVVHRNDLPPFAERVPYITAIVDLEEGVRAMTNVVDCDLDELEVDMPLEVTFEAINEDFTIPVFRPVRTSGR
jgi:uncharacterized OB-fold protein